MVLTACKYRHESSFNQSSNEPRSDIDFEYPSNSAQGQGFADLMTSLRIAFDNLATSKGDTTPYLLTAAVAAGPANYANLVVPQMDAAINFWNLMVGFFGFMRFYPLTVCFF